VVLILDPDLLQLVVMRVVDLVEVIKIIIITTTTIIIILVIITIIIIITTSI